MSHPTARSVEKVGAFIIRQNVDGVHELLLFRHTDMPDVPVQIPGGSIEVGQETIVEAVHREVWEESGLIDLRLIRKVGVSEWFWKQEQVWVRRHVYLLEAPKETPDDWIHFVSGSGSDAGLRFAYYWFWPSVEFRLVGDLGIFLNAEHLPELFAQTT